MAAMMILSAVVRNARHILILAQKSLLFTRPSLKPPQFPKVLHAPLSTKPLFKPLQLPKAPQPSFPNVVRAMAAGPATVRSIATTVSNANRRTLQPFIDLPPIGD